MKRNTLLWRMVGWNTHYYPGACSFLSARYIYAHTILVHAICSFSCWTHRVGTAPWAWMEGILIQAPILGVVWLALYHLEPLMKNWALEKKGWMVAVSTRKSIVLSYHFLIVWSYRNLLYCFWPYYHYLPYCLIISLTILSPLTYLMDLPPPTLFNRTKALIVTIPLPPPPPRRWSDAVL